MEKIAKPFSYSFFQYTIPASGVQRIWVGQADFFQILSWSGASNTLKISVNGQNFQTVPVGTKLNSISDFEYIDLQNTDVGSGIVQVNLGNGDIQNNALTIVGTLTTDPSAMAWTTPTAVSVTTTAALLVAANSARKEIIISNNGASTVYLGDVNVNAAAGRGIPLAAGEKIVLTHKGLIWADSLSGTNSVSYAELA